MQSITLYFLNFSNVQHNFVFIVLYMYGTECIYEHSVYLVACGGQNKTVSLLELYLQIDYKLTVVAIST